MVKGRRVKVVAPILHIVVGSSLGFIQLLDKVVFLPTLFSPLFILI